MLTWSEIDCWWCLSSLSYARNRLQSSASFMAVLLGIMWMILLVVNCWTVTRSPPKLRSEHSWDLSGKMCAHFFCSEELEYWDWVWLSSSYVAANNGDKERIGEVRGRWWREGGKIGKWKCRPAAAAVIACLAHTQTVFVWLLLRHHYHHLLLPLL